MFHSNFSLQSEAKEAYPLVYSSFEKGYHFGHIYCSEFLYSAIIFTSECVAFMSIEGVWGNKSAWSIPVNFFSLLSRRPVGKKKS